MSRAQGVWEGGGACAISSKIRKLWNLFTLIFQFQMRFIKAQIKKFSLINYRRYKFMEGGETDATLVLKLPLSITNHNSLAKHILLQIRFVSLSKFSNRIKNKKDIEFQIPEARDKT